MTNPVNPSTDAQNARNINDWLDSFAEPLSPRQRESNTRSNGRLVRRLRYDFNNPPTAADLYEVYVDGETDILPGDEVVLVDDGIQRRGRVRCLLAVIEPTAAFETR